MNLVKKILFFIGVETIISYHAEVLVYHIMLQSLDKVVDKVVDKFM